jgi:hypothetical protein
LAFRILTQVNYSAGQNPEGDSGLNFTVGLLRSLVKLDADFHFYVLVPVRCESIWKSALSHPRITPLPVEMEPRLHGGDFQYCPVRLANAFDLRRFDIDALFINQPETAPALLHFFNRQTFHNLPALTYVHWFDTRRPSTPKQTLNRPALLGALAGMMVSSVVGVNSQYGQTQIVAQAARWFHADAISELTQRIRLLPAAIDVGEIDGARVVCRRKSAPLRILVNHRLLKYTGVRSLLTDSFPKLWARRQDFSVTVTNPSRARLPGTITKKPWVKVKALSREDYLRELWQNDIVVAPHRACHWSISTLEAICAGCVPLMNRESFFPELMEPLLQGIGASERRHIEQRWFYCRTSLLDRLEDLLDDLRRDRVIAKGIAKLLRTAYGWQNLAVMWRQAFHDIEAQIPMMAKENPSMRRIMRLLRKKKRVSKAEILRHLRWAPKQRALSWTAFRKRLKQMAHEDASSPDAVFKVWSGRKRKRKDKLLQ